MKDLALKMERRQVEALIKYDPVEILFNRRTKISDGAGGYKWSPYAPLPVGPQEVTLIPFKRRLADMTINTEMGHVVNYPWTIVAVPEVDIERGDRFIHNGDEFEVKFLDLKEYVRKMAAVDYYSGTNNG